MSARSCGVQPLLQKQFRCCGDEVVARPVYAAAAAAAADDDDYDDYQLVGGRRRMGALKRRHAFLTEKQRMWRAALETVRLHKVIWAITKVQAFHRSKVARRRVANLRKQTEAHAARMHHRLAAQGATPGTDGARLFDATRASVGDDRLGHIIGKNR